MAFAQRAAFVLLSLLLLRAHALPAAPTPLQERLDTAPPGAVLEIPAGVYRGPLVIRRAVTLSGSGEAVIDGGAEGNVITILADGVTVRGLRITASGANLARDEAGIFVQAARATIESNRIDNSLHGIYLKAARDVRIRGNRITGLTALPAAAAAQPGSGIIAPDLCAAPGRDINTRGNGIHLWNSSGVIIEENRISDSRDGIYFSFSRECRVRANVVSRVRYGLHYMYSDQNQFEDNRFTDSAGGAAMMYSRGLTILRNVFEGNRGFRAYGLLLSAVDQTRIEDNELRSNNVGIFLDLSNDNLLLGNTVAGNYIGIRLTASSDANRFSRNRFVRNLHPAELAGVSRTNRWSVAGVGNYWQDASLVDLDADGVGELPFLQADALGPLRQDFPLIGLLSGSPALKLLEFAQQHVELPWLSSIRDPAPLASPAFRSRP